MDAPKEKRKRKPRAKKETKETPKDTSQLTIAEAEKRIAQLMKKIEELEKRPTKNVIRGVRIAREKSNLAETGRIRKLEAEIEALQKKIKEQPQKQPTQPQPQKQQPTQTLQQTQQMPYIGNPQFDPRFNPNLYGNRYAPFYQRNADDATVSYLSQRLARQKAMSDEQLNKFLLTKLPDDPDARANYKRKLDEARETGNDDAFTSVLSSVPDKNREPIYPHDTTENSRRIVEEWDVARLEDIEKLPIPETQEQKMDVLQKTVEAMRDIITQKPKRGRPKKTEAPSKPLEEMATQTPAIFPADLDFPPPTMPQSRDRPFLNVMFAPATESIGFYENPFDSPMASGTTSPEIRL
jgi:uncharacterized small protein (DUF1192 family)